MDFHSVDNAFQDAVTQGVFPGAVVLGAKIAGRPRKSRRLPLVDAAQIADGFGNDL
jgi:hypothetical protein